MVLEGVEVLMGEEVRWKEYAEVLFGCLWMLIFDFLQKLRIWEERILRPFLVFFEVNVLSELLIMRKFSLISP